MGLAGEAVKPWVICAAATLAIPAASAAIRIKRRLFMRKSVPCSLSPAAALSEPGAGFQSHQFCGIRHSLFDRAMWAAKLMRSFSVTRLLNISFSLIPRHLRQISPPRPPRFTISSATFEAEKNTMASEKQIEANRRNAQLSTGPSTDEGKAAVAQNACKHGIRADAFHLEQKSIYFDEI